LAAGAWLIGRLPRFPRPALLYGILELAIGAYGTLSLALLGLVGPLHLWLLPRFPYPEFASAPLQFLLVGLALLLPTSLMGATLPVLVDADSSSPNDAAPALGRLYAVNTAGAVTGAALCGFFLLPNYGIRTSVLVAAAVNLFLGAIVVFAFRRSRARLQGESSAPRADSHQPRGILPMLSLVVFGSGFTTLFYEVVWTRSLELVVGTSSHAFTIMLTTFLLGLAIGVAAAARLLRSALPLLPALAFLLVATALATFLGSSLLEQSMEWVVALFQAFYGRPRLYLFSQILLCSLLLLPATILMGAIFPLAAGAAFGSGDQPVSCTGRLYALNTLGCLLGALLAGLLFIGLLGLQKCLLLGSWLNLGLAALVWLSWARPSRRFLALAPVLLAVLLTAGFKSWDRDLMTSGVYFYTDQIARLGFDRYMDAKRQAGIIFYREGPMGTVCVKERPNLVQRHLPADRILVIDGRAEANTHAAAQFLLSHIPFALNRSYQDVFTFGLGSGATAGGLTLHRLRRIDVVEIDPAVAEASSLFGSFNRAPLAHPRVDLRIADARNDLEVRPPASYDLIISQPSHPWVVGAAKLFTREFFLLARSRLRSSGVFTQWVQLYGMDVSAFGSVLRTFLDAFPETLMIHVGGGSGEVLLVGSAMPLAFDWNAIRNLFSHPDVTADLARLGVFDPGSILQRVLIGGADLRLLVLPYPLNTDDNCRLEFSSLANLFRNDQLSILELIRQSGSDPWQWVSDAPAAGDRQAVLAQMAMASLRNLEFRIGLNYARQAAEMGDSLESFRALGDLLYVSSYTEEALAAWRKAYTLDRKDEKTLRRLVRHYRGVRPPARPVEFRDWLGSLPATSSDLTATGEPLLPRIIAPSVSSLLP
jgi:spermidine synthase